MEISKILNTGLDMETLATVVRLCESGVNPEALAHVFNELRKESASIKVHFIIRGSLHLDFLSSSEVHLNEFVIITDWVYVLYYKMIY